MKAEKIQKEVPLRAIQREPSRGRVYMEDNRSESVGQAKMIAAFQLGSRENISPGKTHYKNVTQYARVTSARSGRKTASATLGRNIFNSKRTKRIREEWRQGREAQHLVPFSVGEDFGICITLLNSKENGIMLPSGRKTAKDLAPYVKGRLYVRPSHIRKGLAHPQYNKAIEEFLIFLQGKNVDLNSEFNKIAFVIRLETKKMGSTDFVDSIKYGDLIDTWVKLNDPKSASEIEGTAIKYSQYGRFDKKKYHI